MATAKVFPKMNMRHTIQLLRLVSFAIALSPVSSGAGPLGRDRDPVVLTGASHQSLVGVLPTLIVGFRHDSGWIPIPVQVDERAVVGFAQVYNDTTGAGFTLPTYTDAETFTGADPDPTFDLDDELVFMAKDAGSLQYGAPPPVGTVAGSGLRITLADPIHGAVEYVYLFESDGSLDPGPGPDPVTNGFFLLPSGAPYMAQYNTRSGPNPENTYITSANFSLHFSDRWICDGMSITSGGASGVDMLDRRKFLYAPGNCARSEQSFSNGEGALLVSRQGPVRALRGYCGANSGPTTYRVHQFYESREDVVTTLRVHPIPGGIDFFDYSPAASGMSYSNNLNPTGVPIDGIPDVVTLGPLDWEMVTGAQGTVVMTESVVTNIPGILSTSYYRDLAPAPSQCTGDNAEYGASGRRFADPIPNTDPALGVHNVLEMTRVIAYGGPSMNAAFAQERSLEARQPVLASVARYDSITGVEDGAATPAFQLRVVGRVVSSAAQFRVDLPTPQAPRLEIFGVAGGLVQVLEPGYLPAGTSVITWGAGRVPSGVYFARARAGVLGTRTAKFVVAR